MRGLYQKAIFFVSDSILVVERGQSFVLEIPRHTFWQYVANSRIIIWLQENSMRFEEIGSTIYVCVLNQVKRIMFTQIHKIIKLSTL